MNFFLDTVTVDFLQFVNHLPLWGVYLFSFISGFLQVIFPPYPGELLLVLFGYLGSKSFAGGKVLLFLSFWTSIILCNFALYEVGLQKGEWILRNRLISRYFPEKMRKKAALWVSKYGFFVFFGAIFIPGMYLPVVLLCGILKLKRIRAYPGMMFATLVHDLLLFAGGGVVGQNWESIMHFLGVYNKVTIGAAAGMVVLFASFRLGKYLTKSGFPGREKI